MDKIVPGLRVEAPDTNVEKKDKLTEKQKKGKYRRGALVARFAKPEFACKVWELQLFEATPGYAHKEKDITGL
jgi:hypothetical protein